MKLPLCDNSTTSSRQKIKDSDTECYLFQSLILSRQYFYHSTTSAWVTVHQTFTRFAMTHSLQMAREKQYFINW